MMRFRPLRSAAAFAMACLALAAPLALAQPPAADAPFTAMRLQPGEKIPLDAAFSADAWRRAPVFDASYQIEPVRGREPTHRMRVRVLYDDRALYVGVEALDPQAERIRAPLVRHDKVNRTQDFVVLYVDPIGAKKAAQFFRVSASGGTADGLHTADNDNEDFSPDFDFDSRVWRHEQGYNVLFRVPYSSLRYTAAQGSTWRLMVGRRIPRENVVLNLTVALPQEALSFIDRLQPLAGFEPPVEHGFLQIRPTLTLRHSSDSPWAAPHESSNELKPSLDLKWRPRPELVLDATLNPDFSQVELDTPQLSKNSRFALFLTEKRPFFLESSDLLVSPTDALYTRSVNDPRWGLRASWRSDAVAGTALALHDKGGGSTLIPGTYATDLALQPESDTLMSRVRTEFGRFSVGGLVIGRRYANGVGENSVVGTDGQWLINDSWRLKGQLMGSRTTALYDGDDGLQHGPARRGGLAYLGLYGRTERSETDLSYEDISAGFRNDAGFVAQSGIRKMVADNGFNSFDIGPFNQLQLFLHAKHIEDRATGQTVSTRVAPGVWFSAPRNTEGQVDLVPQEKTRVQAGTPLLTQHYVHLWGQTTPLERVPLIEAWADIGRLADVTAVKVRPGRKLGLNASLRLLPRLELEPRVETLSLYEQGQLRYRESATQLLAIWHLAAQQSVRLILQKSSYDRRAEPALGVAADRSTDSAQSLTYAWRRSAGTVLYIGASHGVTGWPLQTSRGSEVFAKLQFDVDEWRR